MAQSQKKEVAMAKRHIFKKLNPANLYSTQFIRVLYIFFKQNSCMAYETGLK